METKQTAKILATLAALFIFVAGVFWGYHSYVTWRQGRLLREARAFIAKSDSRNAYLCIEQAVRNDANDLEACRLMADLNETFATPSTLYWRSRVVELNPGSLDDQLSLAQAATKMRNYSLATNALNAVGPDGKKTAAYHNVAGALDLSLNQFSEAEAHFLEAARLEPANPVTALNLAVLRLRGTNEAALLAARTSLRSVATNASSAALRCAALRELTADAMRYRQTNSALDLSGELVRQTNSLFHDRLLRLDVLLDSGSAGFQPELAAFRREAANDPGRASELASWQMSKNETREALVWLQSLPAETRTNPIVALVGAECFAVTSNWTGLQSYIEPMNWGDSEFLRDAFQARALRGQQLDGASRAKWDLAMKSAQGRLQRFNMLLRLAVQWNWTEEAEEALAAIVKLSPGDGAAFQALVQILFANGHTRSLMQLYSDKVAQDPSNLAAKNNMAWTALLLNAREVRPDSLAREIYDQAHTNSAFASTYAFSLLLQKKNAEALRVFDGIDPRELENPSIAGCYGLVLKANGNLARAKQYLEIGSKAPMLPEQRLLMDTAMREVSAQLK
jgi:predicted Zn-dependent protease